MGIVILHDISAASECASWPNPVFRVRLSIQGIDLSALIAPLLGWDFMPVSLEGEVSDDNDSFHGKAKLKAPLAMSLDPLDVRLKPGSFVIKFGVNIQMLTPAFVITSVYFSILQQEAAVAPTVCCGLEFDVKLDGMNMHFVGAFEEKATGASVWGTWDGTWRDPFGFKGLELQAIGAEYTTGCQYPAVRGSASLYGIDVHGEFGIKLDEVSPINTIVQVKFNRSLNAFDLLTALTSYSGPKPSLIELQDVDIHIAPKGGTIAGKSYEAGLNVAGKASLFGQLHGAIDLSLSLNSLNLGFLGTFKLDPWSFSVDGFEFIKLPQIDASFSLSALGVPTLSFTVGLSLFNGLLTLPTVKFDLADYKLVTPHIPGSGNFLVDIAIVIDAQKLEISFKPKLSVQVDVFGQNIGLDVSSSVKTAVTWGNAVTTQVSFCFNAFGIPLTVGPITMDVPITDPTQLASIFSSHAIDVIKNALKDMLLKDPKKVLEWAATNIGTTAETGLEFVANATQGTGVALGGIPNLASAVFSLNAGQVGLVLPGAHPLKTKMD